MIHYYSTTIGKLTLVQGDKLFKVQLRQSNCLAVFLHVYKNPESTCKDDRYVHEIVNFIINERVLRNLMKDCKREGLQGLFLGEVRNIRLNLYYPECKKLLPYFIKAGQKVTVYYKEPKKK